MKNPKSFYKKLKKLIEEELPDNCMLCYDSGACEVFVVKRDAEFIDGSRTIGGTSWHGVLTPVNEPVSSEGYCSKSVIGKGISIELASVQH